MSTPKRDLVRVVETAYQVDIDEQEWLEQLADVFSSMHIGERGIVVYKFDASAPEDGVQVPGYAARNVDDAFVSAHITLNANTPIEEVLNVYHRGIVCATASEVLALRNLQTQENPAYAKMTDEAKIEDTWGLAASSPGGRGVGIASPLAEVSTMGESTRELWCLVGVHLATAYRLRRRQNGEDAHDGAAVFEPGGKLVHADGATVDERSRQQLSRAVRHVDRARSKSVRQQPSEALPLWRGMIEGRWTLVEHHESDGRRFLIAHPNDPRFEKPQALDQRERRVVAYASQGDSNARISYSLGLDQETVAALLASAMKKLGIESREALMWLREHFS